MSLTEKSKVHIGREHSLGLVRRNEEIVERFHDIKEVMRQRESFEVTNAYVMSVLFDIYWLHAENGGEN